MKFCGFDNFVEMTKDRRFIQSIINTVIYTITTVPASIILGLILAYVMHGNIHGKKLLRLAFFIPYISSIVALGAVFKFLFREDGIINNFTGFESRIGTDQVVCRPGSIENTNHSVVDMVCR
jgi:multiple sugar transport system permease protein